MSEIRAKSAHCRLTEENEIRFFGFSRLDQRFPKISEHSEQVFVGCNQVLFAIDLLKEPRQKIPPPAPRLDHLHLPIEREPISAALLHLRNKAGTSPEKPIQLIPTEE